MSKFRFELFSGWDEAVKQAGEPQPVSMIPVPKSPSYHAADINLVDSVAPATAMAQLVLERPISHIGWDTEFRFTRPGVVIDAKNTVYDVRSVQPLLLSLAAAEQYNGGLRLYRFVVDVRRAEVLDATRKIFSLPVPFVGHYSHVDLPALWQLGLDEPRELWDTWAAQKVHCNGLYSKKKNTDVIAQISAEGAQEEDEQIRNKLVSVCRRHGIPYPMAHDKERLQKSFLTHPYEAPFTKEQIKYASLDAEATAKLYLPQVMEAALSGDLQHLVKIEMPWVMVNAQVTWHGVQIDPDRRRRIRDACDRLLPQLEGQLAKIGISNFKSFPQLKDFFESKGILEWFREGKIYSFDKDHLKDFRGKHPVIDIIYEARRVQSLRSGTILRPELAGADGRVHADHRQLGCVSGRQSSKNPNLLGLDRSLRPLVVPDKGCGIGEVDLSQIEVGIAAAVYGDEVLLEAFNTGDTYCNMAKLFYADELGEEDLKLSWEAFKAKHSGLRDIMKTCTLGIIYGLTAHGLAPRLNVPKSKAKELLQKFMEMFPALRKALDDTVYFSGIKGYATTAMGLKRHRPGTGSLSNWDRNWMKNHPVQGTAAALFKIACIRLLPLYRQYNAKLILLVHDAAVFECPLMAITDVAELTRRHLCEAVQEFFPKLRPRAAINIEHPECWNKEGQADALENWLAKVDDSALSSKTK
jgi:DNA polymerase-1